MDILADIRTLLGETLGLEQRCAQWQRETPLLGSVAELDSAAVIHIVASLEERFGIYLDDDDIQATHFETVGALTALVEGKLAQ
ncbi:acyl carrier protein [Herbaspirillum camelliae]|uniref:acyl carrier protein n=1 Tax=Herbaspirillum camelliae TaxID=1892903 RepID=UPI000949C5AC|nr:acyl carrier protein [Herbaspirillum camelliae]